MMQFPAGIATSTTNQMRPNVPFRSKAQAKWMFSQHPEMAEKWAHHTPSMARLPERVAPKRKKKKKGEKR
jgi:hypothetical protein